MSLKHSSLKTPSEYFKQVHFDWTINQHLDDFTYFKLLYRFEVKRLEVCFSVFTGSLSEFNLQEMMKPPVISLIVTEEINS